MNEEKEMLTEGTRGMDVPTTEGSLPYSADFSGVENGIYTSVYFTGVTWLSAQFDKLDPAGATFTVQLYDVDGKYWCGSESLVTMVIFKNLKATRKYALFSRPSKGYAPASGNILVCGAMI